MYVYTHTHTHTHTRLLFLWKVLTNILLPLILGPYYTDRTVSISKDSMTLEGSLSPPHSSGNGFMLFTPSEVSKKRVELSLTSDVIINGLK